ncbi:uncharacterized protein V1516DRAFT_677107 [Lipomyces oligophaga]|uniref:uncharacterized protein n=1 Tax=Lipomyces oligophaga TaxID=45792 RepID=UPI0034CEADF5
MTGSVSRHHSHAIHAREAKPEPEPAAPESFAAAFAGSGSTRSLLIEKRAADPDAAPESFAAAFDGNNARLNHLMLKREPEPEPQPEPVIEIDADAKPLVRRRVLTVYQTMTVTRGQSIASVTPAQKLDVDVSTSASASSATESASAAVSSAVSSSAESTASASTTFSAAAFSTTAASATTLQTYTRISSTITRTTTYSVSSSSASAAAVTSSSSSNSSGSRSSTGSTDSGSESSAVDSGSLSAGARAGIAIGVIAGTFILLFLLFVLFRRRRHMQEASQFSEKSYTSSGSLGSTSDFSSTVPARPDPVAHTAITDKAPRLSIRVSRPISGLLPLSLLSGRTATRTSTGAIGQQSVATPAQSAANTYSPTSPASSFRTSNASFDSLKSEGGIYSLTKSASIDSYSSNSSAAASETSSPVYVVSSPNDSLDAPVTVANATVAHDSGFAPASDPAPLLAADISKSNTNVHRAVMDFAPTMHDELALQEGQLVRVLHEYDDGWALCVKLDRSSQGVCPRSCLSVRALRPRPKRGVRGNTVTTTSDFGVKVAASAASAKNTSEHGQVAVSSPTSVGTAPKVRPLSGDVKSPISLPAINTNINNQRSQLDSPKVMTPTIQVFAPDSEKPFELA